MFSKTNEQYKYPPFLCDATIPGNIKPNASTGKSRDKCKIADS
jgi:hypothetical protein